MNYWQKCIFTKVIINGKISEHWPIPFCTFGKDTQVHLDILSQVSSVIEEVTFTMSEVPFFAKTAKTNKAVK